MFSADPNGAPGPDGFSFQFYQFFWGLVKQELMLMCHKFYSHELSLSDLNKSFICLIPKTQDAAQLKQYRSISLVNCSFKILSNILNHRLEPLMGKLIDDSQSAFIKGRFILDNVMLSQEIIHHTKATDTQGIVVKIYF